MTVTTTPGRAFVCSRCHEPSVTDTRTGPLPSVCNACDPDRAARRAAYRDRNRDAARERREELTALRARVRDLEAALVEARTRGGLARIPDADRSTLAAAVRAVGAARGMDETRDALLRLRDVAHSWSLTLGAPTPPEDPIDP